MYCSKSVLTVQLLIKISCSVSLPITKKNNLLFLISGTPQNGIIMKSRRAFIKQTISISLGFAGLSAYLNNPVMAYSSLLKNKTTRWLELPAGFNAKLISMWGDKMSDGFHVPANADGMGSFLVNGKTLVVRNHENSPTHAKVGPFGDDMSLFKKITRDSIFDYGYGKTPGLGGTTTFVFDENKQEITNQFLSLVGTYRNCAGGVTPWNSWITCEEDVTVKGEKAEMNHGYNFEVSAFNKNLSSPVPLKAMGRFYHEAVCVDPQTGIVYQTEDRADGLIYRFIPTVKGQLHKGGVLQALAIKEQRECDTRNWEKDLLQVGKAYETEWITLSEMSISMMMTYDFVERHWVRQFLQEVKACGLVIRKYSLPAQMAEIKKQGKFSNTYPLNLKEKFLNRTNQEN
jgi:hypothetical protein